MGLGKLLTRSTVYVATDTESGVSQTFTILDNLAPDWPSSAYRNGMSIPGAWRATKLIAGLLAGTPWHAYRKRPGSTPQLVEPTPSLLEQPSPPDTRFTTFTSAALDYLWHGNAIAIVTARSRSGWPTAIAFVPATAVFVRRVDERNYPLPIGTIEYMIGNLSFTAQDVVHIKGPCEPGALRGLGVLEAHLQSFGLAQDLNRAAAQVSNNGVPTGLLKSDNPDLTQPEATELKRGWLASQRDRTIAVLNASTTFEPLAWNPEESQLIEARQFSLTELELIFELPVGFLGGTTNSRTYSNIEQDAVNLLKFTLGGHFEQFEQTLSQAFPRGMFVRADLDAILRSDTLTRYQAHAIATGRRPWMLPSEIRQRENLSPADGIDDASTTAPGPGSLGLPGAADAPTASDQSEITEVPA